MSAPVWFRVRSGLWPPVERLAWLWPVADIMLENSHRTRNGRANDLFIATCAIAHDDDDVMGDSVDGGGCFGGDDAGCWRWPNEWGEHFHFTRNDASERRGNNYHETLGWKRGFHALVASIIYTVDSARRCQSFRLVNTCCRMWPDEARKWIITVRFCRFSCFRVHLFCPFSVSISDGGWSSGLDIRVIIIWI